MTKSLKKGRLKTNSTTLVYYNALNGRATADAKFTFQQRCTRWRSLNIGIIYSPDKFAHESPKTPALSHRFSGPDIPLIVCAHETREDFIKRVFNTPDGTHFYAICRWWRHAKQVSGEFAGKRGNWKTGQTETITTMSHTPRALWF